MFFILVKFVYSPPLVGVLDSTSGIGANESLLSGFNHPEIGQMASESNVHMGKPTLRWKQLDYWKIKMMAHLGAMGGKIWRIVRDVSVVLKQDEPTPSDEESILVHGQDMDVLYDALDINEFNHIKKS
jgi:hypothetical protein